eukprot:TRINITY_DN3019_c0_g1_i1.p1 TRINITY_DN3019_c0_g1~~TRINITY_DN3019_c0_g1_i1.p1  ORF type:complete len:201 (-),score=34.94 TRINITY_DN3019_c0_g1_i1:117-719(-)
MKCLLVIDMQNDFIEGGSLGVGGSLPLIDSINKLVKSSKYDKVIFTQDFHPSDHISFASSHEGHSPFQTIQASYGEQTLWPSHCVGGTSGSELAADLFIPEGAEFFRKGHEKDIDSYSAFFNNRGDPTGLAEMLKKLGVSELDVCGLALDYCVKSSALDAQKSGFKTTVLRHFTLPVSAETGVAALAELNKQGISISSEH